MRSALGRFSLCYVKVKDSYEERIPSYAICGQYGSLRAARRNEFNVGMEELLLVKSILKWYYGTWM